MRDIDVATQLGILRSVSPSRNLGNRYTDMAIPPAIRIALDFTASEIDDGNR